MMVILTQALIALRLFFWRVFPQFGTTFISDTIFAIIYLVALTLVRLASSSHRFAPFLFYWLLGSSLSVFHSTQFIKSLSAILILSVYMLGFLFLSKSLTTSTRCRNVWWVLFIGGIFSALLGIKEYIILFLLKLPVYIPANAGSLFAAGRVTSLQGWPTVFSGHLILFFPFALLLFLEKKTVLRGMFVISLLLGFVVAKSFLAPLSLCFAFWLTYHFKRQQLWVFLLLVPVLIFAWTTKYPSTAIQIRLEYCIAAWRMIRQHPFLGIGISAYKYIPHAFTNFTHNAYLQVWAESGLLGFLGLTGLTFSFYRMRPGPYVYEHGIYIGLLAVFIDNFFSFTMIKPNLSFTWWVALAIYATLWKGVVKE